MDSKCTRRGFMAGMGALALSPRVFAEKQKPNVLFITVDDMDYGSLGVTGCKVPDITPNIDKLASEGMRFEQAHVTSAICQPCRSVLMTGRYPHRNGAMGFEPINADTPTLEESLHAAGYMNGIMAKVGHLTPQPKFCWDWIADAKELRQGRDPKLFYKYSKEFFEKAKSEGKPFFMMANSQDPHRPFPGSAGEKANKNKDFPEVSRTYKADEITVPPFLPDGIPDIRTEIAQYFTSVHRCDEAVGQLLRSLKESGMEGNTLVMFISDNGISMPYAKTNCYMCSTSTPLIVRWPGRVKPEALNHHDLVSGIDFMPTILDACGVEQVKGMDGRSFLPLLEGGSQGGRDKVFTFISETSAKNEYPMRCVRTGKYSYIYNAWPDGKTVFKNEPQSGLTFKAMKAAGEKDGKIAEQVKFFLYRTREELYDMEADPIELHNLAADEKYKPEIEKMRSELLQMMVSTNDPILPKFKEQVLP